VLVAQSQNGPMSALMSPPFITVFLPNATKTMIKPNGLLSPQLQKVCTQRGLQISNLCPRASDGTPIPLSTCRCEELSTDITLLSQDKFEEDMVTALTGSCWEGREDSVKMMLHFPCFRAIVNKYNSRGQSALFCAARNAKNVEIVIELLKVEDINVNIQVPAHGGTPLHAASFSQAGEIVALLLSQGADLNLKNKQGVTARGEANGAEVIRVYDAVARHGVGGLHKLYPSVQALNQAIGGILPV